MEVLLAFLKLFKEDEKERDTILKAMGCQQDDKGQWQLGKGKDDEKFRIEKVIEFQIN